MARTFCTFGFQRRFDRRCEWLSCMPKRGCLPQISHTDAMGRSFWTAGRPSGRADRPTGRGTQERSSVAGRRPQAERRYDPRDERRVTAVDGERARPARCRTTATLLRAHQEELNRLNVYPVPDGDTGTNMALTLESVCAEVGDATEHGRGVPGHRPRLAHGRPRQLGRDPVADPAGPHRHLPRRRRGRRGRAHAGPAGVGRRRHRGGDAPGRGHDPHRRRATPPAPPRRRRRRAVLVALLEAVDGEAHASVERTPELLPVLARAGVVDAGGRGLALLFDAWLCVARRPAAARAAGRRQRDRRGAEVGSAGGPAVTAVR